MDRFIFPAIMIIFIIGAVSMFWVDLGERREARGFACGYAAASNMVLISECQRIKTQAVAMGFDERLKP